MSSGYIREGKHVQKLPAFAVCRTSYRQVGLCSPAAGRARPCVQLDSPAADAMTDLAHVAAVIVLAGDTVDEAHRRMIQRGVRLLLVVDQDRKVLGVITANDISGEKPVQTAAQQGIHRDEVLVRNIMTPCASLQVLDMEQVRAAKVGHIVATLKQAGRQHTLVVDRVTKEASGCAVFFQRHRLFGNSA